MIHNVAITTPTIGRIIIGEVYENTSGKRLPRRLNHFKITTQFKRDGEWVEHPAQKALLDLTKQKDKKEQEEEGKQKLTSIPVKLMFNDPELSVSSRLEAYSDDGRLACAGNGIKARRVVNNLVEEVDCVGCDTCQFGIENRCDKMTRLVLQIDVQIPDYPMDGMSGFILRSRGHNTYKALTAKIERLHKLFKGNLIGVPMTLRLIGKSSKTSKNTPFYYASLDLTNDIYASAKAAQQTAKLIADSEIDQEGYENMAKQQLSRGIFHDTTEDDAELEEFLIQMPSEGETLELAPQGESTPVKPVATPAAAGLNSLRDIINENKIAA